MFAKCTALLVTGLAFLAAVAIPTTAQAQVYYPSSPQPWVQPYAPAQPYPQAQPYYTPAQPAPQPWVQEPVRPYRYYYVEFRPYWQTSWQSQPAWQSYGPYTSRRYAQELARSLRSRGYQTRVLLVRG